LKDFSQPGIANAKITDMSSPAREIAIHKKLCASVALVGPNARGDGERPQAAAFPDFVVFVFVRCHGVF
jgi:hypothetical protein